MKKSTLLVLIALIILGTVIVALLCTNSDDSGCNCDEFSKLNLEPNSYDFYYYLNEPNDSTKSQTLQFQACDKLFYTVVGKFKGDHLSDSIYMMDGLTIEPKILRGFDYFKDKALKVENAKVENDFANNSLTFSYDLVPVDSTGVHNYKFEFPVRYFPIKVKSNVQIDFRANSNNEIMRETCEFNGFTGGGYECNGKATSGGSNQ